MIGLEGQKNAKVTEEKKKAMGESYSGRLEVYCSGKFFSELHKPESLLGIIPAVGETSISRDLVSGLEGDSFLEEFRYSRESLFLRNLDDLNRTALGIYDRISGKVRLIKQSSQIPRIRIKPKNAGQRFAIEALMAPVSEAPLTLLTGPAGTGKTLLSLATGLAQIENGVYDRMIIWRANIEADERFGYLPGELENKTLPFMAPILDNLRVIYPEEFASTQKDGQRISPDSLEILRSHNIEFGPIGFLQGRSVGQSFVLVEEAQNITPTQAKMIVTRPVGTSKIVMAGDCDQVSQSVGFNCDRETNGLAATVRAMSSDSVTWNVTMLKEESCRGPLASAAIKRMKDF